MKFRKKDNPLFHGSGHNIFKYARRLRKDLTPAEKTLWERLRSRKLNNLKFRRQHAIGGYIADFYCHEAKLIIEIDGSIHNLPDYSEHDDGRTYDLEQIGIRVIRFTNEEINNNIKDVLGKIIQHLTPGPSPKREGSSVNKETEREEYRMR